MTGLIILLILAAFILFVLLSRVGIILEYSAVGFRLWIKVSFFKMLMFPQKEDKKASKPKDTPKGTDSGKEREGGSFEQIKKVVPIIREVLGKLRQRLTIDKLTIRYLSACEDPAQAALAFGTASAGAGILLPVLENNFTIRKSDIRTNVSFTEKKSSIYIYAQTTISVLHLQGALLILRQLRRKKNDKTDKTEEV